MTFCRRDLYLIGGLLLLAVVVALLLYGLSPGGNEALVTLDGREVARIDLKTECETVVAGTHTLIVEDGSIRVEDAPCRDQICVRHAPVHRAGEVIVCLPCNLVITVREGE